VQRIKFYILLFIVGIQLNVSAQNITGSWEGYMPGERIHMNIEQRGSELCGYTYDYQNGNRSDHCIAYFKGRYNKTSQTWLIEGISFIENSGSHVLMRIRLWNEGEADELRGAVYTRPGGGLFLGGGSGEEIFLRKVSNKPRKLASGQPVCFPDPIVEKAPEKKIPELVTVKPPPAAKTETPVKPSTKKTEPVVVKPKTPVSKPVVKAPAPKPAIKTPAPKPARDTSKPTVLRPRPVEVKKIPSEKPSAPALKKLAERKSNEMSRVVVNVRNINLKVYDNGVVDNDTVSIYYNGKLLAGKKWLSEKALVLDIELEENVKTHEITLFAENLGSIPPNTALIVVTAGKKRYELRSKASLTENAVLVFEYRPEQLD